MAVCFYTPDNDRESGSSSQAKSANTLPTQAPTQNPTNEQLLQAFYKAMSLYLASLVWRK